ncbi:MAG: clostripain-related cysteine peptidase [Candidatus Xenobia bacterium]
MIASVRDWGFIVLKMDGEGLADSVQEGLDTLDAAGTTDQAHIVVRAEQQGELHDFVVTDRLHPLGQPMRAPILDGAALSKLVADAMRQYPAKHWCVLVDGHSHDVRHHIADLHHALEGHPVDLLVFDSCYMAQIETASEFADVAHYLVASEEAVGGSRPVAELVRKLPMTAPQVARDMVQTSQEYTESAMDLAQVGVVQDAMRRLADSLLAVTDEPSLAALRQAADTAQHFYVEGLQAPHPYHNTVDVADFLSRVRANATLKSAHAEVVACAQEVLQALPRLVFAEHHLDTTERDFNLDWIDARGAHGVSMYMPTTPPRLRDRYTLWPGSRFATATGWDRVIAHLTGDPDLRYQARSLAEDAVGSMVSHLGNWLDKVGDHL